MRFDIITIFPRIFSSYLNGSMIKRGRAKKLLDIRVHDLRAFTKDKHKKVDDRPYGGGPGMVLKIEPLVRALASIKKQVSRNRGKTPVILFSAGGKRFTSKHAGEWSKKYKHIIMIAGHYEGIDERIKPLIRDTGFLLLEISIGPYVLTGGELPALVVIDAVSRHLPGFLGKEESLEEKRYGVGVPMYTRPEIFLWPPARRGKKSKKYPTPQILLTGNHKKIEEWRKQRAKKITVY